MIFTPLYLFNVKKNEDRGRGADSSIVNDGTGGLLYLSQKAQKATFSILDVFMHTKSTKA